MPPETRNELILPQYHYAYVQDETKGVVQVIVGPYKHGLTASDKPVIYDAQSRKFVPMPLDQAIAQNSNVPEDSYVVLENPAAAIPIVGPNSIVPLEAGRKVNLPGPRNFSLWPGQVSTVIAGHQMRSNEYIVVKVYNVEEATKNWPSSAIKMPDDLVVGTLLVIKGTEVSFFIPPTGLEVVKDPSGKYVRQAVTLEQLEYCILLDEQGEKTFSRGPQVVFPTATQQFVEKLQNSATAHGGTTERTTNVKFRAIELNDQMGIYCKVMAPYIGDDGWDDGVQHEVGEELFITGKQQRIYFPRAEQAIIEYAGINPDTGRTIQRQRYYAIAIPKGEARYVYDKNTGEVSTVKGPKAFLPDPRYQVIVNRVLDDIQCSIWYPGNEEALEYNRNLARTAAERNITTPSLAGTPLTQTASGAVDLDRTVNRQTRKTAQAGAMNIVADTLQRGTQYTPPPKLTLNTKYEGVPEIQVWTGYAVQVVDKSGGRRVVKGPSSILLEYDETLERLIFSTGNPKTMDKPYRTVYLRVDHNKVSDSIDVETRDMVRARIKVSYRIDFEGTKDEESAKWFAVENYVKFFTDHCRSLVAAAVKRLSV
ncbi:MAG: hypothetical protein K2Z81_18720, partial [Cyanobacteria bacterium]|nr:hypothetical protein [Cyanobacteriota bacterium]